MKLPNCERAFVPKEKITEYLLAENHPVGGPKAKFFRAFGFDESSVEILERELLQLARKAEVTQIREFDRGIKFILIGQIQTPIGRVVTIETIWIIERDKADPRFVTAYPA